MEALNTNGWRSNSDPLDNEFINSKAFLLKTSTSSGMNLYDHLADCLKKILQERPSRVPDMFENISLEVKQSRFVPNLDTLQDKHDKLPEVTLSEIQTKLFQPRNSEANNSFIQEEENNDHVLPNLMELCYYFEQTGVGINREEMFRLLLAMKQLISDHQIKSIRFWGKVLGIQQNYYVCEVEEDGENEFDEIKIMKKIIEQNDNEDFDDNKFEDTIPKPDFKPLAPIPFEEKNVGCNKKTYFVCNELGHPWIRLPLVSPAQITCAQKIRKYFTGRLDANVESYPPFPGKEINYLRAQIARISASTHISPLGFFHFDEHEEEEVEGEGRDHFIENAEFEAMLISDLIDPTMCNWVHHTKYILPQGRTIWWNPTQKRDVDLEEDDDDDAELEEPDEFQPEIGPPLLTPVSEDIEVDHMPSWTTKSFNNRIQKYSIALVSSNRWPGAHAFAYAKSFENMYIGWGQKYSAQNYSPTPLAMVKCEFPSGPEITEVNDPTPEEEAALKATMLAAAEEKEENEEIEEIDYEEEDEDDDL